MVKIDLNADLGEGGSADAELMTLVTSVNIACGFHAGDAQTMLASVRNAIKNGVAIGAHPSFLTGRILAARRWISARDGLRPDALPDWRARGDCAFAAGRAAPREAARHAL